MPTRKSTPELVRGLVERVIRGLSIESRLRGHSVESAWPRAVGERLAPHTRATTLREGLLTVEVRSAGWMHEVGFRRQELRRLINEELGGQYVREIRVRLGGAFPVVPTEEEIKARQPTEDELRIAHHELATNGAEEGAQMLARARALQLKQRTRPR